MPGIHIYDPRSDVEGIQIAIDDDTKNALDALNQQNGKSYNDLIRPALNAVLDAAELAAQNDALSRQPEYANADVGSTLDTFVVEAMRDVALTWREIDGPDAFDLAGRIVVDSSLPVSGTGPDGDLVDSSVEFELDSKFDVSFYGGDRPDSVEVNLT